MLVSRWVFRASMHQDSVRGVLLLIRYLCDGHLGVTQIFVLRSISISNIANLNIHAMCTCCGLDQRYLPIRMTA